MAVSMKRQCENVQQMFVPSQIRKNYVPLIHVDIEIEDVTKGKTG